MVYRVEAILPSDIRHDSPQVANYVEADNEQAHQEALDLLDEKRDMALARSAVYQQDLRCYHSRLEAPPGLSPLDPVPLETILDIVRRARGGGGRKWIAIHIRRAQGAVR